MKLSREWVTPITIGTFGLMAITGILMFFHWDTGLNKTAHEWLGWLMVAGVMAHASVNWLPFKRYFLTAPLSRVILLVSATVIAASFISVPDIGKKDMSPSVIALNAVTNAPLSTVALLAGKPISQLMAELKSNGVNATSPSDNLGQIVGKDRSLEAKAIHIAFSHLGEK